MECKSRKRLCVRFISDEDVTNLFVPLNSEGSRASRKGLKVKTFDENLDSHLQEVPASSVQYKQSCLFENGDVAGQQLFGFHTTKHQNALLNKVSESASKSPGRPLQKKLHEKASSVCHLPISCLNEERNKSAQMSPLGPKHSGVKTPIRLSCHKRNSASTTPVRSSQKTSCKKDNIPKIPRQLEYPIDERTEKNLILPHTPYNLRKRFKKKLVAVTSQENYSDQDFSGSESDWENSSSSSSDATSSSESSDESKENLKKNVPQKYNYTFGPSQSKNIKLNFVPAAEEYFQSHGSRKVLTSNHTLGKLRHHLPQEKLQELLFHAKSFHKKQLAKLETNTCSLFTKWNFMLREGFNILLYGVGSKYKLLSSFHEQLTESSVVVNGFFPSLTIQEIVSSVAEDILGLRGLTLDLLEMVDYIRKTCSKQRCTQLYLIVHNIDGIMLRNDKAQEVLALLSSTPNVYLIASIDHINAPLMWDQDMLSMFNFSWWDTTSFQPYVQETAFESSLLIQQSGNLAMSSLQNVFQSLTTNAKNIFLLMVEYQKDHKDATNYNGMPFKKLYSLCRESLLVSSDLALRSQLTEFLDHRLVKSRRGPDGSELLVIPIDTSILDQFVAQQTS